MILARTPLCWCSRGVCTLRVNRNESTTRKERLILYFHRRRGRHDLPIMNWFFSASHTYHGPIDSQSAFPLFLTPSLFVSPLRVLSRCQHCDRVMPQDPSHHHELSPPLRSDLGEVVSDVTDSEADSRMQDLSQPDEMFSYSTSDSVEEVEEATESEVRTQLISTYRLF
ncbi:hypothetical protein BC629DRAFT_271015 [Irpex lacteus]|nr:hypothetical protein BC629DRAFT_271015 [Irpex lacteus]